MKVAYIFLQSNSILGGKKGNGARNRWEKNKTIISISKKEFSKKLGISLDALNSKLEGKEEFYLNEMLKIKEIFQLDDKSCDELFFKEMLPKA